MEKDKTIVEGREAIMKFMGYELKQGKQLANYIPGGNSWYIVGDNFTVDEASWQPELDWNTLMPVVQKINKWHTETMCEKMDFYLLNQSICSSIDMVWHGVIEFITWFNTQPPAGQ